MQRRVPFTCCNYRNFIKRGLDVVRGRGRHQADWSISKPGLPEVEPRPNSEAIFDGHRLGRESDSGDPMRPLMWVSKSHAKLAEALSALGHEIKKSSIPKLLGMLKYSRQVNRKTLGGSSHPDRDAQFAIASDVVTSITSSVKAK